MRIVFYATSLVDIDLAACRTRSIVVLRGAASYTWVGAGHRDLSADLSYKSDTS